MERIQKLFVLLCAIGIVVAVYHSYDEYTAFAGPFTNACNVSAWASCQAVFQSGYDSLFGIPMWVFGIIWFPLMTMLGLKFFRPSILILILMIGNLFTLYLWYLELDVIAAICPVCVTLYAVNYILTLIVVLKFFSELPES